MSRASKPKKHQRCVRISLVLPVSVELIVGTDDAEPSEDSDWMILSVRRSACQATPKIVEENMHDVDFESLAAAAANAQDIQ